MDFEPLIRAEWRKTLPVISSKRAVIDKLKCEFEKQLYTLVMEECRGNFVKCSTYLGITRETLRRRCASMGIDAEKIRSKHR